MSTELDSGGLTEPATAPEPEAEALEAGALGAEVEAPEPEAAPTQPLPKLPASTEPPEPQPPEPQPPEPQPPPPRRKAGHRARRRTWRSTRIRYAVAGSLAAVALAVGLVLPSVQTVLKQSFTRLPQPYAALYFTSDPTLDGAALTVPISVQPTDEGVRSYNVRVWTETASGTVNPDSTTATISPKNGVWATVVTLTITSTAAVVWVALDGTQQTLHYRINGA